MQNYDSSLANTISIFKECDSRMSDMAGQQRVFFHVLCTGEYKSYGAEKINELFHSPANPEHLLERMVSLMHYLQEGYHKKKYEGKPAEYEYAQTEYPQRYLALVNGLNEETLEKIRQIKMSNWTQQLPDNLGEDFYRQIMQDKKMLHVSNAQQRGEDTGPAVII